METALDVLSRAATMVQDANEARLSSKELPTTKWRRERRLRASEYHHMPPMGVVTAATASAHVPSPPGSPPPPHQPPMSLPSISSSPLHFNHSAVNHHNMESPIDMSVTSTTMKPRSSPPPPYREPIPGSSYATSLARPSVITQAPPKRDTRDNILISNRENDNRSTESVSMCDTVIDEHFRRSLGADYVALFGKKSPAPHNLTPSPQPLPMINSTVTSATTTTSAPTSPATLTSSGQQQHTVVAAAAAAAAAAATGVYGHAQALLIPKPAAALLSPAAMAAQVKCESISPRFEKVKNPSIANKTPIMAMSPSLQQQQQQHQQQQQQQPPLLLHRSIPSPQSSPPISQPQRNTSKSPLALTMMTAAATTTATTTAPLIQTHSQQQQQQQQQRLPISKNSPTIGELHSLNTRSLSMNLSPHHSPPAVPASTVTGSSTLKTSLKSANVATIHIKTEPDLLTATTSTPPASPTSTALPSPNANAANSPNSPDALLASASVDDHFFKALGDTWKKLQKKNK